LNGAGTACVTPLTCTAPQVMNLAGTACITPLTCTLPQRPNSNGTQCICPNGGSGALCACTSPQVVGTNGFCQCPAGTSGSDCLPPSSPQIVTFRATPNTVNKNNPCKLQLTAEGAGTCTITGLSPITADANGYISDVYTTSPITETTRFTATCTKGTETVSKNVTCSINPSRTER